MSMTTIMNDVQVVLEEYLDKNEAKKVTEEIDVLMQAKIRHNHLGESFYTQLDSNGKLVFTLESIIKEQIQEILKKYLKDEEIQEFVQRFEILAKYSDVDAIWVRTADKKAYSKLLSMIPQSDEEKVSLETLKKALTLEIKDFKIPTFGYSVLDSGEIKFGENLTPPKYPYKEMVKIAKNNGLRIGSKYEFCLYQATKILKNIEGGLSLKDALYLNSACNTNSSCMVLADDEKKSGYWIAIDFLHSQEKFYPFAHFFHLTDFDIVLESSLAFYVW